jgi:hypothetical protein
MENWSEIRRRVLVESVSKQQIFRDLVCFHGVYLEQGLEMGTRGSVLLRVAVKPSVFPLAGPDLALPKMARTWVDRCKYCGYLYWNV